MNEQEWKAFFILVAEIVDTTAEPTWKRCQRLRDATEQHDAEVNMCLLQGMLEEIQD